MNIRELFEEMWTTYCKVNRHVEEVKEYMMAHEEGDIVNDHIALRTFNHPRVNREVLAKSFLDSGYKPVEDLQFEKKKLDATYYTNDDPDLTRVFISELRIEEFSPELQSTINRLVDEIPNKAIEQFNFCNSGVPWDVITFDTYNKLKEESEYAAWVATFGFIVNHFTISITDMKSFDHMFQVNRFMKENGFKINDSGGEVKGSVEQGLEQSSIMARDVDVQFAPEDSEIKKIQGCYYEFALRYNNFDGFIAGSADKIFESTDNK